MTGHDTRCVCGHSFDEHKTPGAECVHSGEPSAACGCVTFRVVDGAGHDNTRMPDLGAQEVGADLGDMAERVLRRVDQTVAGCWLWSGWKNGGGYGLVRRGTNAHGNAAAMVHRVVYEALVGPIPEGMVLDHLCRNRACVNPSHMEVVTLEENTRRAMGASTEMRLRLLEDSLREIAATPYGKFASKGDYAAFIRDLALNALEREWT